MSQRQKAFSWYIPTFHGDIKLERLDNGTTLLRAYELTPTEEKAMRVLRDEALLPTNAWAEDKDFKPLGDGSVYRTAEGVKVVLHASIGVVQAVLAKELKPGRKLVDAIIFSDKTMEELRRDAPDKDPAVATDPKKQPVAAATVAAPQIGCPVPEFPESEIRATRVLEEFLTTQQLRDYRAHGVFMARGADTGHQYAITHRGRPANKRFSSVRSLYDMTEDRALCVHDWTVPPPEEMLALLLCVSLPGMERHIRHLPETFL